MAYGSLFSSKLLADGKFDEALKTATAEANLTPEDPEPVFVRAQALAALERWEDAVVAFEHVVQMDMSASAVDPAQVDDEFFDALRSWAQTRADDHAFANQAMRRYGAALPTGRHKADAERWVAHFNGAREVWYRDRA